MTLHELRDLADMLGYPTGTAQLVDLHDEVAEETDGNAIDYIRLMVHRIDNDKLPG